MLVSLLSLSVATTLFAQSGAALDIDIKDQNSIKNVSKTLAGSIVDLYKSNLEKNLIPGLFPDPYYFWESGAVFGSLVDYSYLTGDNQYDDLLGEGFEHQLGDYDAFMPANQSRSLGNDDQSFWGLAAMSAAENGFPTTKIGNQTWAKLAANVFETQAARWNDKTCDGGLNWQIYPFNNGYTYKNSISTGQFILLAARLAKFTGNATYTEWAEKAYDWTVDAGLVTEQYYIYDGADEIKNCSEPNKIQWTQNAGIYTEAVAHMWNITKGENEKWKKAATGFANATVSIFAKKDVLSDIACESNGKCNIDQRAFKGVAIRSFARAMVSAPFLKDTLTPVVEASAKAAATVCTQETKSVKCGLKWTTSTNDGTNGLGENFAALAAVQALLVPSAKTLATGTLTSSNGNGTATSTGKGNQESSSGTAKPVEQDGAAGARFVSGGVVAAVAVVVAALL